MTGPISCECELATGLVGRSQGSTFCRGRGERALLPTPRACHHWGIQGNLGPCSPCRKKVYFIHEVQYMYYVK